MSRRRRRVDGRNDYKRHTLLEIPRLGVRAPPQRRELEGRRPVHVRGERPGLVGARRDAEGRLVPRRADAVGLVVQNAPPRFPRRGLRKTWKKKKK